MKKTMSWLVLHACLWAVLYGAFAMKLEGAMYLLKFFAWVMAPLALFLLTDAAQKKGADEQPRPIATALSRLHAWTMLGLLVWHGHVATALAWGLVMLCGAIYREGVKKARGAAQPA